MKNLLLVFMLFGHCLTSKARNILETSTIDEYVLKYNLLAQSESLRSGIPTSIILAQAILESGFGNSDLCKRSNNHFGIKWKKAGDGEFVSAMDDDYDKNGVRVASKFVKYSSASESFRHHSNFLVQKNNYRSLFKYGRLDFVNWAYGLKACGYSTDSDYGIKLIKLIRHYNLDKYDNIPFMASKTPVTKNVNYKKLKFNYYNSNQLHILFKFLKTRGEYLEESICHNKVNRMPILKKYSDNWRQNPQIPNKKGFRIQDEIVCLHEEQQILSYGENE